MGQTKTIKIPQFISLQLTVIPQQEEGRSQIHRFSGNQFLRYDSHNPNLVTQPQFHETSPITLEHTRTIRDLWIEMPTFYRRSVICIIATTLGIVAGFITPSLYTALERLLQ